MTRHYRIALGFAAALALGACGKVQEAASEKAAEKVIESALSKDGGQAKVNLSDGAVKVSTTDASGKSTLMELGGAKFTEADMGLPFYPGAKPTEGSAMRVATGDSVSLQVGLRSSDAFDKVAAFYRDKLKAMADGKQFTDMGGNDGASLSLVDDKTRTSMQVHVTKADKGSEIAILTIRDKAK
ncbi:MAG TPA: hypothetical protein VFO28_02370 [Burkholderiaceae bacterium]|nr:hypothetical protein [Burkholderiaceae bacterium]